MSFQNASQQIQLFVGQYGNVDRTFGAIDFLLDASDVNTKVSFKDSITLTTEKGKLRQVKISYFPVLSYTDPGCGQNLCNPQTKFAPKQALYNITQCTSSAALELDKDDIRLIDGNYTFSDIALNGIMSLMPQWRQLFAVDIVTLLSANMGVHLDGNLTHQVQPSLSTTGQVNPVGLFDIEREFLTGGLTNKPFILGGVDVYNWQRSTQIGAPNLQGQDISKLNNDRMYYDDDMLNSVLADTANGGHIVALDPSTIKYIGFSENAGMFTTTITSPDQLDQLYYAGNQSRVDGVFLDPVTGVLLDFNCVFNPCGGSDSRGSWNFQLQHKWDIFFLPEVAVNTVGPTFNGILHYRTCVPVVLSCPTGQALPSPVASHTYSWTPSFTGNFTLPTAIAYLQVGNLKNNFQNGIAITSISDLVALMNDCANGTLFSVSGSSIHYTGYSAISGVINVNGQDITFTFA
jgi:hypothetical protein